MADNKKYYYLKLKENFYDSEELILLQNMPDGYLYSDILMKLYLRSLKNGGKLMFKDVIPYTPPTLAQIVRHQVGTVEKALEIFKKLGLVEILDSGAIYMLDIQNFIGESSTEADRIRNYRQKIKEEKEGVQMLQQMNDKSTPEIEIEKEIDINKNKNVPYEKIKDLFHSICVSYPKIMKLSDSRKKTIKARYAEYGFKLEIFEELFTKAETSSFLKGNNSNNWNATFDWLINPKNMIKVLEGNFDNKEEKKSVKTERRVF
jgi:predicted phage replisome organizer